MSLECIFCKIKDRSIPAAFVAENENIFVIKDIAPKAPVHYLIIPKKHVIDIQSLSASDNEMAGDMLMMAQHLSQKLSGDQSFRLIVNSGAGVGQKVFHLHAHFLAGKRLTDF